MYLPKPQNEAQPENGINATQPKMAHRNVNTNIYISLTAKNHGDTPHIIF